MARASRTAQKIARFMILLDALPRLRGVLPAGAAATVETILRKSGVMSTIAIDAMRWRFTLRFYARVERWTGRGQLLWFGLRKRWFAERVEVAIAAGARQLLVVGAGFDPLAILVARRHADVLCVEIDAPATAEPKRSGIAGLGPTPPNHRVCAADLAERSLAEVLAGTRWRTDLPSVVVAEGLLMYLAAADVQRFFAQVHACTGPGSRLAFSTMDADAHGRPHIAVLDAPIRVALKLAGEPLRWGLGPSDVPRFLAALDFRTLEQPTLSDLRAEFLVPLELREEPVLPYEHLVLAER